jgi:hypothetical protein
MKDKGVREERRNSASLTSLITVKEVNRLTYSSSFLPAFPRLRLLYPEFWLAEKGRLR